MTATPLLDIQHLDVAIDNTPILNDLTLQIAAGEVHVIIGRNGAGKSSLAHTLVGKPNYKVTAGAVSFQGKDLLAMPIEERCAEGLFMTFQQPVAIAGIRNMHFLKTAFDAIRKARNLPPITPSQWLSLVKKEAAAVQLEFSFLSRSLNDGFSGGEKKRNELLQMRLLDPSLTLFDEIDSGLDAPTIKLLVEMIHQRRTRQRSHLFITHYLGLIEALQPNQVHWIDKGVLREQGGIELAQRLLT